MIDAIEISRHRLPLSPPFQPSWDSRPREHFDATLVRVRDDSGAFGIGSGDAMAGFEAYAELFLGHDPTKLERHAQILDNVAFHAGRCWPLDIALWDLAGKLRGDPIFRMLGGSSGSVRSYASTGTLRDAAASADTAERIADAGYPAMKLRFHRDEVRDDLAVVEAVTARVGERIEVMVDCNQGWRMPWDTSPPWQLDDALPVARALEELGVYWMEEPLHRSDLRGMRELRESVSLRIAGGEMARDLHELDALIDGRCLDVLQPDVVLVGGISGLRRIAARSAEAGLQFTPHTWGNGIGLVANAHLTATLSNAPFLELPFDPPEWSPARRDFPMHSPIEADASGWIHLNDAPGLGIELDEDRLAATLVASERFSR